MLREVDVLVDSKTCNGQNWETMTTMDMINYCTGKVFPLFIKFTGSLQKMRQTINVTKCWRNILGFIVCEAFTSYTVFCGKVL